MLNSEIIKPTDIWWNKINKLLRPEPENQKRKEVTIDGVKTSGLSLAVFFKDYFIDLVNTSSSAVTQQVVKILLT